MMRAILKGLLVGLSLLAACMAAPGGSIPARDLLASDSATSSSSLP